MTLASNDVSAVYADQAENCGTVNGEEIHVGGAEQTDYLAKKAGIDEKGKDLIS